MKINYYRSNFLTKLNASAYWNPDTEPHLLAIASSAPTDLGCGNSRISFLYFFNALVFDLNSLVISTKMFGENSAGKYHYVEDGISNEITSFINIFFWGLVAVTVAL